MHVRVRVRVCMVLSTCHEQDGSTTLEKKDKSITVRTAAGIIVKRDKQGAVLRKAPNGDIYQSTANGDAIHKKVDGHQTQVTENGTLLFLVDPDETSIQIDLHVCRSFEQSLGCCCGSSPPRPPTHPFTLRCAPLMFRTSV